MREVAESRCGGVRVCVDAFPWCLHMSLHVYRRTMFVCLLLVVVCVTVFLAVYCFGIRVGTSQMKMDNKRKQPSNSLCSGRSHLVGITTEHTFTLCIPVLQNPVRELSLKMSLAQEQGQSSNICSQ